MIHLAAEALPDGDDDIGLLAIVGCLAIAGCLAFRHGVPF